MKKKITYFAFFLSIILVTVLWENIKLPFDNSTAIYGDSYLINKHHAQNDTLRFVVFLGVPFLVLIFFKQIYEKIFFKNMKEIIFNYDFVQIEKDKKLNLFFFISVCILVLEFFSLNFNGLNYHVDIFHEGLWLTASQNAKISEEFWQSSYIGRGFFGNFYPNLLWNFLNIETVGVTRFLNLFVILLNKILLLFLALRITNLTNLKSSERVLYYFLLSITLLSFTSYQSPIFFLRSFLLLFLILLILNLVVLKGKNFINLSLIGFLSSMSMFWYIDIGIYINCIILLLLSLFLVKKETQSFLILFISIIAGWFIFYFTIPYDEFSQFLKNTKLIISTIDYIHGLIFPTPFISQDARSSKALLIFLITGFLIITAINKPRKYNLKFLLIMTILFIISILYFKYSLSRSDGGHLRVGVGFLYIPFFSLLFLKLVKIFKINKINNKNFTLVINFIILIVFVGTTLVNKKFENKNISNIISSKNNIIKLINYSDDQYFNKEYQDLFTYYKKLSNQDPCVMIFTNEVAIPYFLKKQTCSKYYLLYTATPSEIQNSIIKDLTSKKPVFLIYKSEIDVYGHAGDRLKILNKYILDQYSFYEKFKHWEIYKLK